MQAEVWDRLTAQSLLQISFASLTNYCCIEHCQSPIGWEKCRKHTKPLSMHLLTNTTTKRRLCFPLAKGKISFEMKTKWKGPTKFIEMNPHGVTFFRHKALIAWWSPSLQLQFWVVSLWRMHLCGLIVLSIFRLVCVSVAVGPSVSPLQTICVAVKHPFTAKVWARLTGIAWKAVITGRQFEIHVASEWLLAGTFCKNTWVSSVVSESEKTSLRWQNSSGRIPFCTKTMKWRV